MESFWKSTGNRMEGWVPSHKLREGHRTRTGRGPGLVGWAGNAQVGADNWEWTCSSNGHEPDKTPVAQKPSILAWHSRGLHLRHLPKEAEQ